MRSLSRIARTGMLILCAMASASAQMGKGSPDLKGIWNPVVGQGAAYHMQSPKGGTDMEITIVGKEPVGGKDGYWMETSFTAPKMGGEMVMKTLIVLDGPNTQISRVIMQMPGQPPMEMPSQMVQNANAQKHSDIRELADDLGSESVTVTAGTFTCEHYHMKDGSGDSWVQLKTGPGPYGLVKFQGRDSTIVLTRAITDAKDKITGTPQPFDPMQMTH